MNSVRVVDLGLEKGKALVTNTFIHEDAVLFSEKPLISCQFSWNRFYGYQACDYCLQPLETAEENARRLLKNPNFQLPKFDFGLFTTTPEVYPCTTCFVGYCSLECRQASANEYHPYTCPALCEVVENNVFERLDEEWRNSHFPPESGTVMIVVRIAATHFRAFFNNDPKAKHIVTSLNRFVSNLSTNVMLSESGSSSSLVHNMLGPEYSGCLKKLHSCFIDVLNEMARRINPDPFSFAKIHNQVGLDPMLSEIGFCTALCLIGRNSQGIGTSALGQWGIVAEKIAEKQSNEETKKFELFLDSLYKELDETAGEFLDNEGVGLYENQSLINHSCQPNALVQFTAGGNELQVVAKAAIPADTEVTISYLNDCMLERGQHSRRKYLAKHYLFICQCVKCVKEHMQDSQSVTTSEDDESDEEMDDS